jgi:uncharacterized protein (TIGR03437 family)
MKRLRCVALCWMMTGTCMALTSPPFTDYVTYLGGTYRDTVNGMAVDSSGSVYVAGTTSSPDFPITTFALGTPSETGNCAFVTKLNPTGTAVVFSVCVANAQTQAFAMDAAGNLYLAINRQTAQGPNYSVLKLDPAGTKTLYETSIAASPEAIAVDSSGNAYVAGSAGPGLATTPGAYQSQVSPGNCAVSHGQSPCPDAFAVKLSPAGTVVWATYLGGSGQDDAHAIAVDATGNVWIAGETVSKDFPVTANAFDASFGGEIDFGPLSFGDAFVAKLDSTGSKLLHATYLGGSAPDGAFAVAVDAAGSSYVAGGTSSSNFPATAGAVQTAYSGPANSPPTLAGNGFVTKFTSSGSVVYSTYLGGSGSEGSAVAVDANGEAAVNAAPTPPATSCTGQPALTVLSAAGSAIAAISRISGSYLAEDGMGGLYAAGTTRALAFLSTPHVYQPRYGGGDSDGFAAKVDFSKSAGPELFSVVNAATLAGGSAFPITGAVAPGEIVTLFGNGFGSQPAVNFDQFPAPVFFSSNCQINAVVPFSLPSGVPSYYAPFSSWSTFVTVVSSGQTVGSMQLPVLAAAPGIFTTNGTGMGQAAVLNQDGTVNGASNPAPRGTVISVFMTGAGAVTPSIADGSPGPLTAPYPMPVQKISAQIGSVIAPIIFAGQAPALIAGVTQINVAVPLETPTGASIPLVIQAGGYSSSAFAPQQSPVFVAIQ